MIFVLRQSSHFFSPSLCCWVTVALLIFCFMVVDLNSVGLVDELGLAFSTYKALVDNI